MTMLCHNKRDKQNFYNSLEKNEKLRYIFNCTTDLCKNLTRYRKTGLWTARLLNNSISKIQHGGQPPFWKKWNIVIFCDDSERVCQAYRCCAILVFLNWFFNGRCTERHVLHYRVKFCENRSRCCRDMIFFAFLVKCKKPLDDCT